MKNVKMAIIYNMMDVTTVNINVSLLVLNVLWVNVTNVKHLDGTLIHQPVFGHVKNNVEMEC